MEPKKYTMQLAGRELSISVGDLAQMASGSVVCRYGDTVVLATAMMSSRERDIDFLPLSVSYQEKYYAAGMIKGSRFIKREARPTDEAILSGRVIDRGIRPLFAKGIRNDIQIMANIIAYDRENKHDMVSAIASSAALAISDIPWNGPLATGRIGLFDGKLKLNPTVEEMKTSDLDLIVTISAENVVMIDAAANQIPEEKMYEAILFAQNELKPVVEWIASIAKEIGKKKREIEVKETNTDMIAKIAADYSDDILKNFEINEKLTRMNEFKRMEAEAAEKYAEEFPDDAASAGSLVEKLRHSILRKKILETGTRVGGRKLDEIRPISTMVGILPCVHGSAVFTRGETQGMTVVTIGSPGDQQLLEDLDGERKKKYMHHYNFPPFSVGECSNRLFTGNREIGHGALAERALSPVLPSDDDFPYTLRLVTEILSSNGSSSMAATCGSTMSLMDAGVPITSPVSGIAMGLMANDDKTEFKILFDMQDDEDFGGDMDFKVTGTAKGITAIQMDIKLAGLPVTLFREALEKARIGYMHIMGEMLKALPEPRKEMSKNAPRITTLKINPDMIRVIIGKGGETINKIIDETGVNIDLEDDGTVFISSNNAEATKEAIAWIERLTYTPKVGDVLEGKVVKIMDFGAFVEIAPGRDGMCHISELAHSRVNSVDDVVKEGEILKVKVMNVDEKTGKIALSHKETLDKE